MDLEGGKITGKVRQAKFHKELRQFLEPALWNLAVMGRMGCQFSIN